MELECLDLAIREALKEAVSSLSQNSDSSVRVFFPCYTSGSKKIRISEQELRFAFVEKILPFLCKNRLFYAVETPTTDTYMFTKNRKTIEPKSGKGQSANFDLTIHDSDKSILAAIEFKAKTASKHEYAKDFCKLLNPKEPAKLIYFANLFESESHIDSFKERIYEKNEQMLHVDFSRRENLKVLACLLKEHRCDEIE